MSDGCQERAQEAAALDAKAQNAPDLAAPPHRSGQLSKRIAFTWERHSEGSSLTLFFSDATQVDFLDPHSNPELADALEWAESLPGKIVRATRIWLTETDQQAEQRLPEVGFSRPELVSSHIGAGARFWSDFRIQPDGFGRLIVSANGMEPRDFTRLVQRLQELGNYRNKALLGLPVAQENWPHLNEAEARLTALAARVSSSEEGDDALMEELSSLSLGLMAVSTSVSYRMSATAAYARLVEERLEHSNSQSIEGFASLSDFSQRRLLPVVRTCAALNERERQLSLRASQLSSLLRARIETRIENQNAKLLRSMDSSASLQLRLQQLVEGLSVVALTYYLLSLVGYMLKGAQHQWPHLDVATILAVLVVPTALSIWLALRQLKRRVLGHGSKD